MSDYATQGSNVYLPLTIKQINDYDGKKYIKCSGSTYHRDLKTPSGWKVYQFGITVKVEGFLTDYVDYELCPEDRIFVVGHLEDTTYAKNGIILRHVLLNAESIYKADYLKYFSGKLVVGEK